MWWFVYFVVFPGIVLSVATYLASECQNLVVEKIEKEENKQLRHRRRHSL